ncbi:MAG: ATP-binding protein [Magnetococcus sp. YQC-3]
MVSENNNSQYTQVVVLAGGLVLLFLGLLFFLGWYTHYLTLVQEYSPLLPMRYNTAIGFVGCGAGFLFLRFGRLGLASLFGVALVLLGGFTLMEHVFNIDYGINQLLGARNSTGEVSNPDRISPSSALCFVLLGTGMISRWVLMRYKHFPYVVGVLGGLVSSLSMVAFSGYYFKLDSLHGWGFITHMEVYAVAGFIIAGICFVVLAWSLDGRVGTRLPDWFPVLFGIGMITITLILWQFYQFLETGDLIQGMDFSIRHAHDALLVFGVTISLLITLILKYNQTAQERLTKLKQEEEKTNRLLHTKNVLNSLLQLATKPHTLDQLLEISLDHILTGTWIATMNKGAIFLYDKDCGKLVMRSQRGIHNSLLQTCNKVPSGECLCGIVFKTGEILFANSHDARHTRRYEEMAAHSHYCVPINTGEQLIGVINLYLHKSHVKSADEEELLGMIAKTLSWIIEHKQHEQGMIEQTVLINNILNSSPDLAIAATDKNYCITYYNEMAEKIFGYTKEQVIGQTVQAIHTREQVAPERFERAVEIVRRDGIYRYRVTQEKNGEKSVISSRVSGIMNQSGQISGYILVSQDITDQMRMEESLRTAKEHAEKSAQAKSVFLATMSHDIRTPMNAILGMGEILKESGLNQEQSNYLRILTNAGKNLLALINDILDLSKVEAGQLSIEALSFDLHQLTEETHRILLDTATAKNIVFDYRIQSDCPQFVVGDPERIRQVLLNLIGNAIKFTERGSVKLSLDPLDNDLIKFTLTDTGIGIKESEIEFIFEPFKQADKSISHRFGGTGLGLSICKRLVEAMGGSIQVQSEIGKGTVFQFTVRLPRSAGLISDETLAKVIPEDTAEAHLEHTSAAISMHILLVDDTEDNRLVIKAFLKKTPHRLVVAVNGEEGVKKFIADKFDLVLMDIQMPVLDGYGATLQIRKWEQAQGLSPTPIVALTADAMRNDMERTAAVGCDLHLSKPVKKAHLLNVINQFIQR